LTEGADVIAPLRWSPDGSRLLARQLVAVSSGRYRLGLVVIQADGSGVQPLLLEEPGLGDAFEASWSPDGRSVAVQWLGEALHGLYWVDLAGGETQQPVEVRDSVQSFAWSPDGTRLAYFVVGGAGAAELRIWSLADSRVDTIRTFAQMSSFNGLAWSPDGTRLIFAAVEIGGVRTQQLYLLWSDGSGLTPVTGPPATHPSAAWSPDGRQIVYTAYELLPDLTRAPSGILPNDVYALEVYDAFRDPGGLQPIQLTTTGLDANPQWQP
jgi:TolB protein